MSESRKALRNFYKLPGEVPSETASDAGSELNVPPTDLTSDISRASTPQDRADKDTDPVLEPEEEPLTQLEELDRDDVDIDAFVKKLTESQTLPSFIGTVGQIKREQTTLASAQRELVNDNYKKLIKAAEMLGYISAQGDLASIDALAESVDTLAQWTAKLDADSTTN